MITPNVADQWPITSCSNQRPGSINSPCPGGQSSVGLLPGCLHLIDTQLLIPLFLVTRLSEWSYTDGGYHPPKIQNPLHYQACRSIGMASFQNSSEYNKALGSYNPNGQQYFSSVQPSVGRFLAEVPTSSYVKKSFGGAQEPGIAKSMVPPREAHHDESGSEQPGNSHWFYGSQGKQFNANPSKKN